MNDKDPKPTNPQNDEEPNDDSVLVEGGEITDLEEQKPVVFQEAKHRADTTRLLAFCLVGLLFSCIILHYVCLMVLEMTDRKEAAERIGQTFNNWLPVLTGLAGAAVTYYFTKEK